MSATLTVSPALPQLPVTFDSVEHDSFEAMYAPLSFFWLARVFNLSGNKESKEKLMMRIRHLTKLYNFPEDLFEQLVAFGDDKRVNWSPRVPEVVGVRALQRQLELSEQEYRILVFAFLSSHSRLIGTLREFIEKTFSSDSQLDIVCKLVGIDRAQFAVLTSDQSTIVQMHLTGPAPYSFVMESIERFYMHADVLAGVVKATSIHDDILAGLLTPCAPAKLTIDQFDHVGQRLQLLKSCVLDATNNNGKPLSVLFVGKPGTGKTELAKALAASVDASLYEVAVADDNNRKEANGAYRLGEYLRMSNMLKNSPHSHILFDEVEDVLNERENANRRKGWINQTLEQRVATTYWVCNSVDDFDEAFLRRFDYVLHMPTLDYRSRVRMMRDAFTNHDISKQRIHELAAQRINTPATIERLAKLAERIKHSDLDADQLLDMALPNAPSWYSKELGEFNLEHCQSQSSLPLQQLVSFCQQNQNMRLVISGDNGTGKTALARHLCFECNQSTRFYAADNFLINDPNMFHSVIESAFEQATIKHEMLVIDEVDQLLLTAMRIMPNAKSFARWLGGQIRDFRYPLAMTLSDDRALSDYPEISNAFDLSLKLTAWPATVIQDFSDRFAQLNKLKPITVTEQLQATPQQVIKALRQCRLHGDMRYLNQALFGTSSNAIGFLARVS
jgi:DNA replication protein DnaC